MFPSIADTALLSRLFHGIEYDVLRFHYSCQPYSIIRHVEYNALLMHFSGSDPKDTWGTMPHSHLSCSLSVQGKVNEVSIPSNQALLPD